MELGNTEALQMHMTPQALFWKQKTIIMGNPRDPGDWVEHSSLASPKLKSDIKKTCTLNVLC